MLDGKLSPQHSLTFIFDDLSSKADNLALKCEA